MSRDNWGKLVGAVLRREKDRQLAYFESFSSSSSADLSSRSSFDGDIHESADLCSANIFFSRDVKAMKYKEIRRATSYFSEDSTLRGGFGYPYRSVYKGWIDENYVAAVKPGSGIAVAVTVEKKGHEGLAYWRLEDKINLCQYRHPNLVIPIGYYAGTDTRIFVNEFVARGSLDRHLFIEQKPLPWATRMRVAVGAAGGLAFLHETHFICGVLTSRDILLDADFNAKLSHFGIAKDYFRRGRWGVVERPIKVEYGQYAAPEFVNAEDSLSTECDVYCFGVVLMELLSGLRGGEDMELGNLIMDLENKGRPSRIMDGRLEGKYLRKEAIKVAHIARQCVSQDPRSRPRMAEVVAALEKP